MWKVNFEKKNQCFAVQECDNVTTHYPSSYLSNGRLREVLKTIENSKLLTLKVVTVAYERWSQLEVRMYLVLMCQLIITRISNIKDVCCKPRLHDQVKAGVWPPCCATSPPAIHATGHVDHEKRVTWFSISIHACSSVPIVRSSYGAPLVPIVMVLRLVLKWKKSTTELILD